MSILYSQFSINAVADGLLLCSISAAGFGIASPDEVCVCVQQCITVTVQGRQYPSESVAVMAAYSSITADFPLALTIPTDLQMKMLV